MTRLIASMTLLAAAAASITGCVVAPPADYGYAQPYYPYAYGPPYYGPAYGSVGIYGGFGGSCCYYRHGYWHGHGHGGWHGGGG
ncbi:hypothetical protein F6X40_38705, partial [Paraburkholderia sp. UCT31]